MLRRPSCGRLSKSHGVTDMVRINASIEIPRREIELTYARSPGPGGQNVNKVNSKAILRWNVADSDCLPDHIKRRFFALWKNRISKSGDLVLHSHRHRDQARNTADCLDRLRDMVRAALVVPKKRKPTRPSLGSKKRRLESKKRQSQRKQNRRPVDRD